VGLLTDGSGVRTSPDYALPDRAAGLLNPPLPDPPGTAVTMAYSDQTMLHEVRAFVAAHGAAAGLRPERIDDLCIVVNELAANTCEHTDRPGRLSMWVEPGIVACQVDDHGFISDPLTGRVPPSLNSTRGRGLLIVQSLCDLVRVYTGPHGTSIRVHVSQ
jgi:anti-sigma regulatory factor (Ser/Thr protein kinase)